MDASRSACPWVHMERKPSHSTEVMVSIFLYKKEAFVSNYTDFMYVNVIDISIHVGNQGESDQQVPSIVI